MSSLEKTIVCRSCKQSFSKEQWLNNYYICPNCGKYGRIPPRDRIKYLADGGSFTELFGEEIETDPLAFPGYAEKKAAAKSASGENEAVLCGTCEILGITTCIFVMNSEFMMASMGSVVGDRLASLFEYAIRHKLPVVGFSASGGARMQEGVLSLMQMAKVSLAIKKHNDKGLFYLLVATDPTYGGVTASFASLGDVIIAEPHAMIGFAGRRVIEQNTGEKLPDDFQTAEFLLEKGFLDGIVPRVDQRNYIARMLALHK